MYSLRKRPMVPPETTLAVWLSAGGCSAHRRARDTAAVEGLYETATPPRTSACYGREAVVLAIRGRREDAP
jgi:hypothetical protein